MFPPIDIIIPCYSPSENWSNELENFYEEAKHYFNLNFILVNDGGDERKLEPKISKLKSKEIQIQMLSYSPNKGKGYALRHGVQKSNSEYLIYTDVDFPFTNKSILNAINLLIKSRCDVVASFRNQDYYAKEMTWFRKFLSKTFRFFIKNVIGLPVSDTQCGLKGFNKNGKEKFLQTKINRYLFDFEFIYSSCKDNSLSIEAIEVQLKDNVTFSKMKLYILIQEFFNLLIILFSKK